MKPWTSGTPPAQQFQVVVWVTSVHSHRDQVIRSNLEEFVNPLLLGSCSSVSKWEFSSVLVTLPVIFAARCVPGMVEEQGNHDRGD
jgi:hypothetical protein